jgi:hypothetical protein
MDGGGGGAKKTFKIEKVMTKDSEKFKNSSDISYLEAVKSKTKGNVKNILNPKNVFIVGVYTTVAKLFRGQNDMSENTV